MPGKPERVSVVTKSFVCLFLMVAVVLSGCGGGGGASESSVPSPSVSLLAWDPPQTYDDQSPLDPYRELDYYEFYVRTDPTFTIDDQPVAQVAAVSDILSQDGKVIGQKLTDAFELANLSPFLPPGTRIYLTIRVVGIDGRKSGFAEPVIWDLSS